MKKRRGRPPKYQPEQALGAAMQVFWKHGFEGTSLDELARAMNMNRPSIYNAFGDKESIYRKAMVLFGEKMSADLGQVLFDEPDLRRALKRFYRAALDVYLGGRNQLGCFVTCTAAVEAANKTNIRKDLREVFRKVDGDLEKRLLQARATGQFPEGADVGTVAKLLHATLQSLALRSRSGEKRASLERWCCGVVDMLADTTSTDGKTPASASG